MRYRSLAAAALLATVGAVGSVATEAQAGTTLVVLTAAYEEPPEPDEAAKTALWQAQQLAEQHPDDFGYPWLDETGRTVVLDVTSGTGVGLAEGFHPAGAAVRLRTVTRSFDELERIKDEVIDLAEADVPGAKTIRQTAPDPAHNRVLITVDQPPADELLAALAARYGKEAVAVSVDPDFPEVEAQSRQNDTSPFYGGARIQTHIDCSSGFSWVSGSTPMMLTAGHCIPDGGFVETPVQTMGTVTRASRENWNRGVGTVPLTGQTVNRGDLALIQMHSGRGSAGYIFRGGPTSSATAPVKEMWHRGPVNGDLYCTGGATTGELCGWKVWAVGTNIRYSTGEVVRNVAAGSKTGHCARPGDSGGPVYTVRGDGGIAAKGIHSGHGGGGGDYFGGIGDPCYEYFTNIWEAHNGLPGVLRKV